MDKLKIAYVVEGDARDVHTWSGLPLYIAKALEKQGAEIYYIDNLGARESIVRRLYAKIYSRLPHPSGKQYHSGRTIAASKKFAREIERRIPQDADVVFAPSGTIVMAFVRTTKKKIIFNDAVFASMIGYYEFLSNLSGTAIKEGNIIEKKAFENCDLLLFSSDWAANSAKNDYHIDGKKIKVVPFGANIDIERTEDAIKNIIEHKSMDECRLLFIGVDWERKGGAIAVKIAEYLHHNNIKVHLDIAGIRDMPGNLPDYVSNHGYISKKAEGGQKQLDDLFAKAHFFVLPTRQECFGVVFSEAASYALPCIATKTGGVKTAVRDDVNGKTFDLDAPVEVYGQYIAQLFQDKDAYKKLCYSTFNEYQTRLNWDVIGRQIIDYIGSEK
jgi:glycosyltransferase involved in cell wall biosynthesis